MKELLRTSQDYLELANLLETNRYYKQASYYKTYTSFDVFYSCLDKAIKAQKDFNLYKDDTLKNKYKESLESLESLAVENEKIKADFKSLEGLKNFVDKESNLVVYNCCIGIGAAVQMFFSQVIYSALKANFNGFIFIDKSEALANMIGVSRRQLSTYINAAQELGIIIPAKYFNLANDDGKRFIKKMFFLDVKRLLDTLKYLQMNGISFMKFYKEEIKNILEASPFEVDKERLAAIIAKEEARREKKRELEELKEINLAQAQRIEELEAELERLKANVNREVKTKTKQKEAPVFKNENNSDCISASLFNYECDDVFTPSDHDKKENKNNNIEPPQIINDSLSCL